MLGPHTASVVLAHVSAVAKVTPHPKGLAAHIVKQSQELAVFTLGNATAESFQTVYYTEPMKHFLLIGCLSMFLGAVVFGFMAFKSNHKLTETITFIIATIAAGSYYMMYNGYGVARKDEGDGKYVLIFPARYLDWLLTTPLLLLDLAMLVNADAGEVTMLLGNDILMVLAGAIGATQLNPYKWFWWVVGMIFFILVFLQLLGFLAKVKNDEEGPFATGFKTLILVTFLSWCIYPIIWILGSEGLNAISLDVEVGLVCIADIVAKLGFGFYLLFAVLETKPGSTSEAAETERTSLV